MTKIVRWSPEKLKDFKVSYAKALKEDKETFTFQGNEYRVDYAKYLIEYLDEYFRRDA